MVNYKTNNNFKNEVNISWYFIYVINLWWLICMIDYYILQIKNILLKFKLNLGRKGLLDITLGENITLGGRRNRDIIIFMVLMVFIFIMLWY